MICFEQKCGQAGESAASEMLERCIGGEIDENTVKHVSATLFIGGTDTVGF